MNLRRNLLAIGLIVAMAALIPSGAPLAGSGSSDYDINVVQDGKVVIVTTDEDGNVHEEEYEFFGGSGAYLGVRLDGDPGSRGGARVERVIEDTPAAEAGLRDGDIILSLDGHDIEDAGDITRHMRDLEPGDRVELKIERDGRTQTLDVELGERKGHSMSFDFGSLDGLEQLGERMGELGERLGRGFAFRFDGDEDGEGFDAEEFEEHMRELEEKLGEMKLDIRIPDFDGHPSFAFGGSRPKLGVQLVATTPELREHLGGAEDAGVLVSKVLEGMPAEAAGVRVGDLIIAVDGVSVESAGDLIEALEDRAGESVEIELVRDGRSLRLEVELEDDEPAGDRALGSGYRFRFGGGDSMGTARRAYAKAMASARESVQAAAAERRNVVNDAMRQYRRALAQTRDLSLTY